VTAGWGYRRAGRRRARCVSATVVGALVGGAAGLSGCAAPGGASGTAAPADPGDLGPAVCRALGPGLASGSRWFEARTDLDGDGHDEALAYVAGPMVCGSGGCTLYVFTGDGADWRLVGEVAVSRPPVRVLDERHQGWRSLVVHIAGGGQPAAEMQLDFDGRRYPANATVAPARPVAVPPTAPVLIAAFQDLREGRPVPAGAGCR